MTGVSAKCHQFVFRAKTLKRSWFSIADTLECCCLYDAFWCAYKCWRIFYLFSHNKDTGTLGLFRTHACNVSACCSSCWTSCCTVDRSISPYARLYDDPYGILKKKNRSRSRSVKVSQTAKYIPHDWRKIQKKTNFVRLKKQSCSLSLLFLILTCYNIVFLTI